MIKKLGYKVNEIEILPFGGNIKTNLGLNSLSKHILLISVSGVLMQFVLWLIFMYLYNTYFISLYTYQIFLKYNSLIILFNLLPIYPLDGSKIFNSILEMFLSFRLSIIITNILSIVILILFFFLNIHYSLDNYLIITFLTYKLFLYFKEYKFILNKFYIERYLSNNNYKKVKYIKNIKDIRKNYYNFINNESEEKILKTKIYNMESYKS